MRPTPRPTTLSWVGRLRSVVERPGGRREHCRRHRGSAGRGRRRRPGQADGLRLQGGRGGRGRPQLRPGGDGGQAGLLPRPRAGLADRVGSRRTDRHRRAVHAGMAGGADGRWLRRARSDDRPVHPAAEQATAFTDESSPAYLPGFFQIAYGTVRDSGSVIAAARDGGDVGGVGWHEHNGDVHTGCERFFRPGYLANLIGGWLPALDGVVDKLQSGRPGRRGGMRPRRLDDPDGPGVPEFAFVGVRLSRRVDRTARQRARAAGVADRITFEVRRHARSQVANTIS